MAAAVEPVDLLAVQARAQELMGGQRRWSFGVAVIEATDTVLSTLSKADKALYESKTGRPPLAVAPTE